MPLPACITGSIDIVVNASLINVSSTVGYSVGMVISIADAVGPGSPLITTITAIGGGTFSLADAASATVVDVEVCPISAGGGRWFGPSGDCGCCDCSCEDARDSFGDAQIIFTGGAAAATLDWAEDIRRVCYGAASTGTTYSFPGVTDNGVAVGSSGCQFYTDLTIGGTMAFGFDVWEGSTNGPGLGCLLTDSVIFAIPFDLVETRCVLYARAEVVYACDGGTPRRQVTASVFYSVFDQQDRIKIIPGDPYAVVMPGMHASWTLASVSAEAARWTYSSGGIEYEYTLIYNGTYFGFYRPIWKIRLSATSSTLTTVSLAGAPAHYDPLGLLVGVATVS